MSDAAYMLIRSAGQTLAIPSEFTRQVVPLEQIAPLPAARGVLHGLMAAAGRVVPVLNVERVLGQGHETGPSTASAPASSNSNAIQTPVNIGAETDTGEGSALAEAPLALLLEMNTETLCLPLSDVIGFITDEPETFAAGTFLSEEKVLGGYSGGGHRGRFLNPQALFQEVASRLTPV